MVDRRWLMAQLGAVGGPLLVLLGARVVLSPPAGANASSTNEPQPEPLVVPEAPPLSPEQRAVVQWANSIDLDAPLSSPLAHLRKFTEPVKPAAVTTATVRSTEGLILRSVVGRGSSMVATINGRIYRVGDEVRSGLRIVDIDAVNHAVELIAADGSTHRLEMIK